MTRPAILILSIGVQRRQAAMDELREKLIQRLSNKAELDDKDVVSFNMLKAQQPVLNTIRALLEDDILSDDQKIDMLMQEADVQSTVPTSYTDISALYAFQMWTGFKALIPALLLAEPGMNLDSD
jgi:hypothetical protein